MPIALLIVQLFGVIENGLTKFVIKFISAYS